MPQRCCWKWWQESLLPCFFFGNLSQSANQQWRLVPKVTGVYRCENGKPVSTHCYFSGLRVDSDVLSETEIKSWGKKMLGRQHILVILLWRIWKCLTRPTLSGPRVMNGLKATIFTTQPHYEQAGEVCNIHNLVLMQCSTGKPWMPPFV